MKLAVFGLGKLGAPLAAVFAHKGHQVVGVDVNPGAVDAINRGETPVDEPQFAELIAQNRERLSATDDAAGAARDCEASLIIVPTPSRADGSFSSDLVLRVAEQIGRSGGGFETATAIGWLCSVARSCPVRPAASCCRCSRVFPESVAVPTSASATTPSSSPWAA